MSSLYDRLGGAAAVNAAVDIFYNKVLNDARIKHFFVGIDMTRQIQHQKQFLTYAFGGTANYSGNSLREAHKRLVTQMGLNDSHFDAVVENLAATLNELGVGPDLIDEVALIAESVRPEVLNQE